MEKKFIINLRLEEVGNQKKIFSLMHLVLKKLKQLQLSHIDVEYFELRLHRINLLSTSKEAYLKIDADHRTFTGSEVASQWDDAILKVCDRLQQDFINTENQMLLEA